MSPPDEFTMWLALAAGAGAASWTEPPPLTGGRARRNWWLVQAGLAVAVCVLLTLTPWLADRARARSCLSGAFPSLALAQSVFSYCGAWACVQLFSSLRSAERLNRKLREAELRGLRTQINPHFLYNTLNAISELGYNEPASADRVITLLSRLLRKALDEGSRREIRLQDELEFLDQYLDIQKELLRDRLVVCYDVSSETRHTRVPGMILQPLAENALTHGVRSDGVAHLVVRARRAGRMLVVDIEDQGRGFGDRWSGRGIGLANVRERLRNLYDDEGGRLELHHGPEGGAVARLIIPFHEAYAYDETSRSDRG